MAAALAYYSVFSLTPLLVIVIALAGIFLGQEAVQGKLVWQIQGYIGQAGAEFIQSLIVAAFRQPRQGIVASMVGVVVLLMGAMGVFLQLRSSLNTIFQAPAYKQGMWIKLVIERLISFSMILVIGFLMLISFVLHAILGAFVQVIRDAFPALIDVIQVSNITISFIVIWALLCLVFRYLPNRRLAWKELCVGSFVSAMLFTLGKSILGWYFGVSSLGSSYGGGSALVILLVWIYYSAQIVFLGAECTFAYANLHGSLRPAKKGL